MEIEINIRFVMTEKAPFMIEISENVVAKEFWYRNMSGDKFVVQKGSLTQYSEISRKYFANVLKDYGGFYVVSEGIEQGRRIAKIDGIRV